MSIIYPPLVNGLQKTLGAQLDTGVTASATFNNTTNIQNKQGLFLVDRIDTSGNEKDASLREYVLFQAVSGSTVTTLTRGLGGTTDQDHATGAVVEFVADVVQQQAIIDAFLVEHSGTDGKHTSATVTTLKASGAEVTTGTEDAKIVTPKALADATLTNQKMATAIKDSNGNELFKLTATASAVNEVTYANAATGGSPTFSATGDDTNIGLDMKMKGTGKFRKPTVVGIQVLDSGTATAVGDGKAFFRVPAELNGMNLTGVAATVYTAGTTNTTDIQIRNKTDSADMLSTKITIDSGETDTSTAATAAVIDTTKDDVVTGDVLAIDIDAVSTTAAKGLYIELRFELP